MLTTLFRDRLPKGLCFPIGLSTWAQSVPVLSNLNAAAVFVWQSTWASQLFDAKAGVAGLLTIMQIRGDLPRMRINGQKVRELPEESQLVVSEFAVSSAHRSHLLAAFADHGGSLLAQTIKMEPNPKFLLHYKTDTSKFSIARNRQDVW